MVEDYNFYGYNIKVEKDTNVEDLETSIANHIASSLIHGVNKDSFKVRKVDDKFVVNFNLDNMSLGSVGTTDDPDKFNSIVLDKIDDILRDSYLPFTVKLSDSQVVDPRVNNGNLQAQLILRYEEPKDEKDLEIERLKKRIHKLENPEFEAVEADAPAPKENDSESEAE